MHVDGDTDTVKSYELEKVLAKRQTARRGTEYLVRWKGFDPVDDSWRNLPNLKKNTENVLASEKSPTNGLSIKGQSATILKLNQISKAITYKGLINYWDEEQFLKH